MPVRSELLAFVENLRPGDHVHLRTRNSQGQEKVSGVHYVVEEPDVINYAVPPHLRGKAGCLLRNPRTDRTFWVPNSQLRPPPTTVELGTAVDDSGASP